MLERVAQPSVVPTVENAQDVVFHEDGKTWGITRDKWLILLLPDGSAAHIQMLVSRGGRAGDELDAYFALVDERDETVARLDRLAREQEHSTGAER